MGGSFSCVPRSAEQRAPLAAVVREEQPVRVLDLEDDAPAWFSGSKGCHVAVELAHNPLPAVGFNRVCRTLAEALAACSGVAIDTAIYDVNHIIRLPNTRHPKTGLFKVRLEAEAPLTLDVSGILETARRPWANGIPAMSAPAVQLVADSQDAEREAVRAAEARDARRGADAHTPDERAPRYFLDLLRFGVDVGERHQTLFRCAG